jgi:hypothetical protein
LVKVSASQFGSTPTLNSVLLRPAILDTDMASNTYAERVKKLAG